MQRNPFPLCCERDHTELRYHGDAGQLRLPPGMPDLNAGLDYVFLIYDMSASVRA
jgi:hypothetical protein